jgi:hypothetical protein
MLKGSKLDHGAPLTAFCVRFTVEQAPSKKDALNKTAVTRFNR